MKLDKNLIGKTTGCFTNMDSNLSHKVLDLFYLYLYIFHHGHAQCSHSN